MKNIRFWLMLAVLSVLVSINVHSFISGIVGQLMEERR